MEVSYDGIGRRYHSPDGRFYSVTTMLAGTSDSSGLDQWRARVGADEADRIARLGADLGEEFHSVVEGYLTHGCLREEIKDLSVARAFKKSRPVFDENITYVHALELAMWSKKLRLAGRVDGVVDWNGELAIIDFKLLRSIYLERQDFYKSYFLQLLAYAQMWWETMGERPTKAVLFIAHRMTGKPYPLVIDPWVNIEELVERIKQFHGLVQQLKIRFKK